MTKGILKAVMGVIVIWLLITVIVVVAITAVRAAVYINNLF